MPQFFNQLPGSAKVWIYQSSRELNDSEVKQINGLINEFVQQWTSHSQKVMAEGVIAYNRFVILAADESATAVGGCSIDSSVHFIRLLEEQFGIELFNRLNVAYRDNGTIKTIHQSDFQQLLKEGLVNQDTIVFNNLATSVDELNQNWEVPVAKTWHARLFKTGATLA